MKRIVISAVILVVMSVGCFYSVSVSCDFTDKLIEQIHEIEDSFEKNDIEAANNAAKRLNEEWGEFVDFAILINDLGLAVDITSSLAEIQSFAEDANDEIYASCDRAEAQIDLFRDMQMPTLWKIL
ncbi:MAG: DUF4363 family protein [Oscillospiraceae bacterium]|nr:DUF4363 family protein [Oscillospiraceae bacterium]